LKLLDASIRLGSLLLSYPEELLKTLESSILKVEKQIFEKENDENFRFKPYINARLFNLPLCSERTKNTVSSIRSKDVSSFISVPGTVVKTGAIKMLEFEKEFECLSCKKRIKCTAEIEQNNTITKPISCTDFDCNGKKFKAIEDTKVCKDYQEIKIQDKISQLKVGSIPRSITVILEDDLVDTCKAGDDVVITVYIKNNEGNGCQKMETIKIGSKM
jgi:DNA helicase MCM9